MLLYTPPKLTGNPENTLLEKEKHPLNHQFLVSKCSFSGVYTPLKKNYLSMTHPKNDECVFGMVGQDLGFWSGVRTNRSESFFQAKIWIVEKRDDRVRVGGVFVFCFFVFLRVFNQGGF